MVTGGKQLRIRPHTHTRDQSSQTQPEEEERASRWPCKYAHTHTHTDARIRLPGSEVTIVRTLNFSSHRRIALRPRSMVALAMLASE